MNPPLPQLNKGRFIKLNHGIIDINAIVGVSDIFYLEAEVKPRSTKKKTMRIGLAKKKIKRLWSFNVFLKTRVAITVTPTIVPFKISSNSQRGTFRYHQELIQLLLVCGKGSQE